MPREKDFYLQYFYGAKGTIEDCRKSHGISIPLKVVTRPPQRKHSYENEWMIN